MDIMAIVNAMQPETISKLALHATDFPNGESSIPFMGVFVQLFTNKSLPTPAAVTAYEPTYDAAIAAAQAAAIALPDIPTQIANLTAAVVALGGTVPAAQITAANATLTAIGQPTITIDQTAKPSVIVTQ